MAAQGSSPSTALTKRPSPSSNALMPPPPPPKRIKRPSTVLDEDVYTDALSHIIARDFFPGLLESESQNEYLEALESNNSDWIRDARRRLTQVMTPGPGTRRGRRGTSLASTQNYTQTPRYSAATTTATPRGWRGATPRASATPAVSEAGSSSGQGRPRGEDVDTSLSLGAFQAKYTSEDNESFNGVLDKQNAARAAKYAFLHPGNAIPSARQLAHRAREERKLLESGGGAVALRPSQDLDTRPASIETARPKQGARNTMFFAPDGVEGPPSNTTTTGGPTKAVSYAATRLPDSTPPDSASAPASPSLTAVSAALAGRPRPSSTDPGFSGAETPRVAGYAFVDAEPTPSELGIPVTDAEAEEEDRAAAEALLPRVDSDGRNPFFLAQASRREEVHARLVEKSNYGRRKTGDGGGLGGRLGELRAGSSSTGPGTGRDVRTATPRFASFTPGGSLARKREAMTPAARMLAARIGGTPGRKEGVFGGASAGAKGKGKEGRGRAWTPAAVAGVKRAS